MPVNPPLLAVALVFRSKRKFDGPDDVISIVSAYVDSSVEQPLHKACKFGSVALLDRIWNTTVDLESSGWGLWSVRNLLRTQKLYGKLQFSLCLLEATKINSVDIAQWLFDRFPYGVRQKVICEAAKVGALEILQFFRANGTAIHDEDVNVDEWDEEREDWEKGRFINFGGYDATHAALAGHTDLVKWLFTTDNESKERRHVPINAALSVGNIELGQWIHTEVEPDVDMISPEVLRGAAAHGLVETLQWFQDNEDYTTYDIGTLIKAAAAGQLEVVQWIIDRDRHDDTLGYESDNRWNGIGPRRTYMTCLGGEASLSIHAAAINGHLEVAKYLYANIEKPCNKAQTEINRRSRTWYYLCRCLSHSDRGIISETSGQTMMLAAERGYLEVVEWLYTVYHEDPTVSLFWTCLNIGENGYTKYGSMTKPVFYSVVDVAAGKGHLAIVQYLLHVGGKTETESAHKRRRTETHQEQSSDNEVPTIAACTTVAMDHAAAEGHLEVVRWLHANCLQGCTTDAMDLAACNGHLETVKWLHANRSEGCTTNAMDKAAGSGHLHVVKWLHKYRSEGCTTDAMDRAAGGGHFEILKWLHENRLEGCTDKAASKAAAYGDLDIVKWLHIHQAKFTEGVTYGAARGGHLRVLRWLFENRKEEFTTYAIELARGRYFEAVLILHNIAQKGLAKGIEAMDAEQSITSISDHYHDIAWLLLTPREPVFG